MLSVVLMENAKCDIWPRKKLKLTQGPIEFGDKDLDGTTQPHDDALLVTARINSLL